MAGRKPGTPKTGGRKKGAPNKANADLRLLAQEYTAESVELLVEAMRDATAPIQARMFAARELLDRGHGKPPQAVTGEGGGPIDLRITWQ